jgi:hypothetical protein
MCVYMRLCARWQEEVQFRCPRCFPLSPRGFLLLLPVFLQHLHTRKRRQRREKREERKKTRKQLILRIPGCSVTVTRSSRVIALWVRVLWKCCGIHSLCCGTWCVLRRTAAAWVCARARLFCLPFLLVGALLSGLQAAEGGGGEREKRGCRGLKRVLGTRGQRKMVVFGCSCVSVRHLVFFVWFVCSVPPPHDPPTAPILSPNRSSTETSLRESVSVERQAPCQARGSVWVWGAGGLTQQARSSGSCGISSQTAPEAAKQHQKGG